MSSRASGGVDPAMAALLVAARRCSASSEILNGEGGSNRTGGARGAESSATSNRHSSDTRQVELPRRASGAESLMMEEQKRRFSEAGVNRRPSAAHILTEDTDSFIIGQRVYVDGVKPGRIQFIGETKFGPGEWSGVFLDEPIGKNDGSVMNTRYFTCEPRHGVFSRLYRLTREPIEGAEEILNQCRRFGYEIIDAPSDRRGSVGGSSRRGSIDRGSLSPHRSSTPESRSPRRTPEPYGRASPDANRRRGSISNLVDRRNSLSERRGSLGIPARKFTPGKSPLASPNHTKMYSSSPRTTESREIKIERDPDIERLASEARRLSMGGGALTDSRRGSLANEEQALNRRASENRLGISRNGSRTQAVSPRLGVPRRQSENQMENGRRSSESQNENGRASPLNHVCHNSKPPSFSRRQSEQLMERRGSYSDATHSSLAKRENSLTRRGSGAGFERRGSTSGGYDSLPRNRSRNSSLNRRGSGAGFDRSDSSYRRGSSARSDETPDDAELARRRLSEAGLRRPSATDIVLNNNTDSLMVGQEVWVDGSKKGRIAYIGTVHFAKGEMAGIHLDQATGKNNGTVGGILYFQTEPRHGLFSRLHRLALYPLPNDGYEE